MKEKKIIVTGKGHASKKPDAIEINITLVTVNKNYGDSINISSDKVKTILKGITNLGVKETDLKTTNYSIKTVYKSVKDNFNNYNQVFNGYSCNHSLSLEIDMDLKLLGNILGSISSILETDNEKTNYNDFQDKTNLTIKFTLKDKEGIKNEAVENAIKVAKEKAKILADTADVKLGEIIDINYSFGIIDIYSDTDYERGFAKETAFMSMDMENITPEDIKINDTVTITWNIE